MRALVCGSDGARLADVPRPAAAPHELPVRVRMAGICRTDLELVRGYMDFHGTLGHEFVGEVPADADSPLAGRRVVGEINAACGDCAWCARGLGRHCPHRTVLGIMGRDGAFAEWLTLPAANLRPVPDVLADETATFVEPVAAAFEMLEQVAVPPGLRAIVHGDGKLGLVCAQVLHDAGADVTLIGRHADKLALAEGWGIRTQSDTAPAPAPAPLVVEATGRAAGCRSAVDLVEPRGTLVLKSTVSDPDALPVVPLVVNEITVVGSRCGLFEPAIAALAEGRVQVDPLIQATYPLADGPAALEHAGRPGALKVLLDMRNGAQ